MSITNVLTITFTTKQAACRWMTTFTENCNLTIPDYRDHWSKVKTDAHFLNLLCSKQYILFHMTFLLKKILKQHLHLLLKFTIENPGIYKYLIFPKVSQLNSRCFLRHWKFVSVQCCVQDSLSQLCKRPIGPDGLLYLSCDLMNLAGSFTSLTQIFSLHRQTSLLQSSNMKTHWPKHISDWSGTWN